MVILLISASQITRITGVEFLCVKDLPLLVHLFIQVITYFIYMG
jgi:hypothetical protein